MLATAVPSLPTGDGWAYEFKWDGVRALVDVSDGGVRVQSRAGNDVTGGYPELVAQAEGIEDALLDGEIVAFEEGRPSFERLQQRMHVRGKTDVSRLVHEVPVTYVVFDVLRRFGVDLTDRPYAERRATLERFGAEYPGWTISPSFDDGPATLDVARAHGLEGVVAKRLTSIYRPGQRSDDWRKLRLVQGGEFVVLGWEAAPEHPATLSSLVLGITTDDGLRYAGKVGSGLTGRLAGKLKTMLTERDQPVVPGIPRGPRARLVHWVEPEVVVDVQFTMVTSDGVLRQPVFRGIRTDKGVADARG
jgi:bifunctional non-homologous end joining protein LigD